MPSRYPGRAEFDAIHVGNVCRDLDRSDPRGWRLGGGVAYAALTSARLGLRSAALIGADAVAARAVEVDLLRDSGVTVRIVPLAQGPVFENVEGPDGRVQTCIEPGEPLPVAAVPEAWVAATWLVVPIAAETGPDWAAATPEDVRLVLGWQGLLRTLVAGRRTGRRPPVASPLLSRADLVGVSRHDLPPGTPMETVARLLRPGASLVVTDGAAGGVLLRTGEAGSGTELSYRAIAAQQVDPTGAGDAFLAALGAAAIARGARADDPGPTAGDLRWAAAASALVVEGVGLGSIPERAALIARLEKGGPGR